MCALIAHESLEHASQTSLPFIYRTFDVVPHSIAMAERTALKIDVEIDAPCRQPTGLATR